MQRLFSKISLGISFLGCLAFFVPPCGFAQISPALWFRTLGAEQGLAQSYNWYIYHDSKGFVWISSVSGLNRFDGSTVKQYYSVPGEQGSLRGENVYSDFFEDDRADLWFSTSEAIHRYNRRHDNFMHYFMFDPKGERIEGNYQAFFLERDSFLWVGADTAIYLFNIHKPGLPAIKMLETRQIKCRMGVTPEDGPVRRLFAYGNEPGVEVHEIPAGGKRFDNENRNPPFVIAPGSFVFDVYLENDSVAWITTDNLGLVAADTDEYGKLRILGNFMGKPAWISPFDDERLLVVCRGEGIFLTDKKNGADQKLTLKFLEGDESPVHSFKGVYLDREDNLWIPDANNGLAYTNLKKSKFLSLPKMPSIGNNKNYSYWSILENLDGTVWLGANPGGLFLLDRGQRLNIHYHPDPETAGSLLSGRITDLCLDSDRNLWIATNRGLAWLPEGHNTFRLVPDEKNVFNRQITHIHMTRTGRILTTTESSGLFELTGTGNNRRLAKIREGSIGAYQTIFEDTQGFLYLPKNSVKIEVCRLEDEHLILLDSIPVSGLVNGFYEDECNETLYFGTSNGLVKVDKNNLHADPVMFTEKDGLPGKFIGELEADANGNLWLGTNRGLAFFDKANQTFRSFSLADGAQSLEFHITASMKSRNGELWFGGSEGITIVPADGAFRDVQTAPKVVVTGIKINDEEQDSLRCVSTGATNISQIRRLNLKYRQRTLSFEFIAIEYSDPANNQLKYKLEGRDDNWVELEKGKPGFARYSKLPHGNYTLMLQGANSDGVWGPPQEVIYLNIATPFFLSRWFFALLGLAFLSLVYAVYRNRVERIRKKEEMLRKEAEVRQQMAETETAILRLQMNPHFIFNSMNSINAYILKKDINTASDYLGRFAKLMRMILDLAAKPLIPVSDEIELLKLYLQTEAMRFEHKFSYVFEVDESLDPDDVVLPTMILQPFVENAIWHGLSNKKGEGLIRISFKKENEMLHCVVEDNGIGRDAALHSKSGVTVHESKAMSITLRRLELLEKNADEKASCQVLDLVGPEGRASGTRIVLNLPFL